MPGKTKQEHSSPQTGLNRSQIRMIKIRETLQLPEDKWKIAIANEKFQDGFMLEMLLREGWEIHTLKDEERTKVHLARNQVIVKKPLDQWLKDRDLKRQMNDAGQKVPSGDMIGRSSEERTGTYTTREDD